MNEFHSPGTMKAGWFPAPDQEHVGQERYWDGFQWLPSWRPASERAVGRATAYVRFANWAILVGLALGALGWALTKLGS